VKTDIKNKRVVYTYRGDLKKEVESCRRELEKRQKETSYLLRRLEEENKRFTKNENRIIHLKNFLNLVEQEERKMNDGKSADKVSIDAPADAPAPDEDEQDGL